MTKKLNSMLNSGNSEQFWKEIINFSYTVFISEMLLLIAFICRHHLLAINAVIFLNLEKPLCAVCKKCVANPIWPKNNIFHIDIKLNQWQICKDTLSCVFALTQILSNHSRQYGNNLLISTDRYQRSQIFFIAFCTLWRFWEIN